MKGKKWMIHEYYGILDVNWKHFDEDGEIKVYSEKVNGPTKEKLTDIIAVPINHWITLQNTHLKGLPWFLFTFQKAENTHFNTGTNRKHLNNT